MCVRNEPRIPAQVLRVSDDCFEIVHAHVQSMKHTDNIQGYHAHVYFDAETKAQAQALCETAAMQFGVQMGHMHDRAVGPHPLPSCQLGATPAQFEKLLPWLALNRDDLVVFCHPETGAHLEDHRDHGIWLSEGLALNLSIFR
ncbi:Aromatic ring-cleaving dioxygenase [Cognatishimia activa]|uniref:Aromatic ring-cleaving dioxygenase n=2 Tax=Cognatishimia activa TaxID=1715691 RepID=A0A0N7MC06_9RHOB|nr:Aromatic ring-cleaving dioxygenase [Cognatishimia activa]CUK26872.1 Aromatic ring-cleaving dioxygenase [Cognatishimia activa]